MLSGKDQRKIKLVRLQKAKSINDLAFIILQ
ncbi:hypothetical protein LGAS_1696 [Lactobacillus gasseri ATCC 33323 = JCM 1131]|uniref:Uncharacterized protein n=1 Tax=Lactobacillus gasseri (strain ATCC 33323 / DSM 20243 / BCRC 14619 / CIP 102991 / JCM 1131 / KCTC 3163 / NCIMB 11718 / NCTC 13722 / AM63) TaxID=324831 RepID=A0A805Z250_LACGA|nr:hypothetical protein LGAS_1696 [Lactobacillus gasseri ATCC 33323 = JCM 1131]